MASTAHENDPKLRARVRGALSSLQKIRSKTVDEADLLAPAIVFAPHQDDETLGCGGTLIRKSAAGAPISVVFMTDGSGSHSQRMGAGELAQARAGEALNATRTLGIAADDVKFLGVPDGALTSQAETLMPALLDILAERRPEQVFVPYARDRLADHVATHDLVVAALRTASRSTSPPASPPAKPVTVFEYPVWFWNHWPWMQAPGAGVAGSTLRFVRESLALLMDLNTRVAIGDVLETKIAALECHRTQMTHFDGTDEWLTLYDVADGDFLRCLLRDVELFHRWSLH